MWASLGSLLLGALALATLCLSSGCSSVAYLAQSAQGHLSLLASARPVDEWLARDDTAEPLKERLRLTQRIRDYASAQLALPDNHSYRRYAELGRPAAVWNVVAAPALSLELKTWCFVVVGCVGYRGYFDETAAQAAAEPLRQQGWEVDVYPVPAYSTLGYSEWVGGDPLLSSFIQWPEGELARLIFHELSHQVVYVSGDTMFNESFATAVERLGGERWLQEQGGAAATEAYHRHDARRRDLRALLQRTRLALQAIYQSDAPDTIKQERKAVAMAGLRTEYAQLKAGAWGGYSGYDAYVARLNNASLGVSAAYHQWVPAFEALYEQQGRSFAGLYDQVRRLADLPRPERDAALRQLMPAGTAADLPSRD